MFRGRRRVNRAMLLSRLYRWRATLYALLILVALVVLLGCALLVRGLLGLLG